MTAPDTQTGQDMLCPTCYKGRLHPRRVTERFPYEMDGETTMVVAENVPVDVCDNCGEQLSGPEAARIRHEAICRALGLLTPAEIRSIRERLGLTQEQFTKLTRIGEATICRWERGRLLQNPAMDRYLRLIALSEDNVRFLQELQGPESNRNGAAGAPAVSQPEGERQSPLRKCPADYNAFALQLCDSLRREPELGNPGKGKSTVKWCDGKRICYKRGRKALFYIDLSDLYKAYRHFSGRSVTTSDLKKFAPHIFDSKHEGHNCHSTFFFMALKRMGVVVEIWGSGRRGNPFGVTLPPIPASASTVGYAPG